MKTAIEQNKKETVNCIIVEPLQQANQELTQQNIAETRRQAEELYEQVLFLAEQQRQEKQKALQHQLTQRLEHLNILADGINALATQLETEILQFQAVAIEINPLYHAIQQPPHMKTLNEEEWKPLNILEVNFSTVPTALKQGDRFVLIAKH